MIENKAHPHEQVWVNTSVPSSYFFQPNIQCAVQSQRSNFQRFIKSRTRYLDKLRSLGDDWISGGGKQPQEASIDTAKEILNNLEMWYSFHGCHSFTMPKIVMSPTPNGGIHLEIQLMDGLKSWINIINDDVEFEIEKCGHFTERDTPAAEVSSSLIDLYTSHDFMSNTQWRNSLPICKAAGVTP